jgi:hypothetical protein
LLVPNENTNGNVIIKNPTGNELLQILHPQLHQKKALYNSIQKMSNPKPMKGAFDEVVASCGKYPLQTKLVSVVLMID